MFPAPPPSAPAVKRGTPLAYCAAGASVWYAAIITVHVVVGLRTGWGLDQLGPALLKEVIVWLPTTIVTWLLLRKIRIEPWILIVVTLPIYIVMWLVFVVVSFLVAVLLTMAGLAG